MNKDKLLTIVLILLILGIGWFSNDLYRSFSNKRDINGLWINENLTKSQAMNYAQSRDRVGDWVCINVRGMTIKEMISTCEHEAGHEIFAENCEGNIEKCLEVTKKK